MRGLGVGVTAEAINSGSAPGLSIVALAPLWIEERAVDDYFLVWFPRSYRLGGQRLCFTLAGGEGCFHSQWYLAIDGELGSFMTAQTSGVPTLFTENVDAVRVKQKQPITVSVMHRSPIPDSKLTFTPE